MLGPSGSGKTTCLRMIAGFEIPTSGSVSLHGRDVTGIPPYDRDVNTVFQDYALFPHMTVAENVGYGPMVRKVGDAEREDRIAKALAMVHLDSFRGPEAEPAVRGAEAAGGPGPGVDQPPLRAPARRALGRPRPQAPAGDAVGAQDPAAGGRHHLHLRDPRPGGGADDERPPRGLQSRSGGAGGNALRRIREPAQLLRRRVRGHLERDVRSPGPAGDGITGAIHGPTGEDQRRGAGLSARQAIGPRSTGRWPRRSTSGCTPGTGSTWEGPSSRWRHRTPPPTTATPSVRSAGR